MTEQREHETVDISGDAATPAPQPEPAAAGLTGQAAPAASEAAATMAEPAAESAEPHPAADPAQPAAPTVAPWAMPLPASAATETKSSLGQKLKYYRTPILGLVIVAALGIGGKMINDNANSKRNASGAISKKGDLGAMKLKAGDCFQTPDVTTDISTVTAIPCAQPHTSQVYAVVAYPGVAITAPSQDDIQTNVGPLCEQAAKDKVDPAVATQNPNFTLLVPQGDSWSAGDTSIQCVIEFPAATTGSSLK